MSYIEDTLIKLRREYTKDEVVSALYKKISDLQIEKGQLQSEVDHLNYTLSKAKKETHIEAMARVDLKKQEIYNSMVEKIKNQQKQIEKLKRENGFLISKNILQQNTKK